MEELSENTKALLRETEHIFWDKQQQVSARMYEIMFEKYPETKKLFKEFRSHQSNMFGASLMAHIISLEDPEVLNSFRVGIARRHVKSGVQEKHYEMLIMSLFESMDEILGNLLNKEAMEAWKKWIYYFANLLIERERDHYQGKHLLFPENG